MFQFRTLQRDPFAIALTLLGVASAVVVAFATAVWGPGVDNDVVDFMAATDSLLAGDGFVQSNGRPFSLWPPLPVLLFALGRLVGLAPTTTAAILGCGSMATIVVATGSIVRRATGSGTVALLAALGCAMSSALYASCVTGLSEPLFVASIVVAVRCAMEVLDTRSRRAFVAMTVATALVCLQRYLGVALLASLAAVLLFAPRDDSWRERLRRCATFCVAASAPLALWCVRNLIVVGELTGPRPGAGSDVAWIVGKTELVIQTWFAGSAPHIPGLVGGIACVLIAASTFTSLARARRSTAGLVLFAFPLVYFALSTWLNHRMRIDGIADRQVMPLAPFVWIALGVGVHALLSMGSGARPSFREPGSKSNEKNGAREGASTTESRADTSNHAAIRLQERSTPAGGSTHALGLWLRCVPALICLCLFAAYGSIAVRELARRIEFWREEGADYYMTRTWSRSQLAEWVRGHPLDGVIFSNDPHAVYLWSKRHARQLPVRPGGFGKFAERVEERDSPDFIVWFQRNARDQMPRETLERNLVLRSIVETDDGAVFAVQRR